MSRRKRILILGSALGAGDLPPLIAVATGLAARAKRVNHDSAFALGRRAVDADSNFEDTARQASAILHRAGPLVSRSIDPERCNEWQVV